MPDAVDRAAVRELLGRQPQGAFEVVVRDEAGAPVVIRNEPLLDDGTPMPTRFWLIGPAEVRAVARLESAGGVRTAERDVDAGDLAEAHRRYAEERDAALPPSVTRRPDGGVGGTRQGVKCLHAHYAWHLAGGDDPVGRWVAAQLTVRLDVEIGDGSTAFTHAGHDLRVPVGTTTLLTGELAGSDPPLAAQLTNALGLVTDHVDDVLRDRPEMINASDVTVHGAEAWHFAVVEHGGPPPDAAATVSRDAAEEVFRSLVSETRAERLHNPGLDADRVDSVVATCCVVLGVMRRLHLERIRVEAPATGSRHSEAETRFGTPAPPGASAAASGGRR